MNDNIRPIFIAGDESPDLVTADDAAFVSSSRELRGITVYVAHILASIAKEIEREPTTTLVGNLRNRFVCRLDDPETAAWVGESIGETVSSGLNYGPESWTVDPRAFSTKLLRELKQGGGKDLKVEAVVTLGGDKFKATGRRWYRATFRQKVSEVKDQKGVFQQILTSNDVRIAPKAPRAHGQGEKGGEA